MKVELSIELVAVAATFGERLTSFEKRALSGRDVDFVQSTTLSCRNNPGIIIARRFVHSRQAFAVQEDERLLEALSGSEGSRPSSKGS